MSAPERIFAWAWDVNPNMGQWETQQSIKGEGAEYIRADTVAEMIRQAVADATGLHLVIAEIREATVGGKPMLSDLPAALLEWRQQAVEAEREACARVCERKNSTGEHDDDGYWMEFDAHETARVIARTIRARGEA